MTGESGSTCFVLMPFSARHDRYYANIYAPAVEAVYLTPMRGDSLFASRSIMDDIWRSIRSAVVLIADLTGQNANVFYELGLAHAIGKPVVLVSQTLEDVPFDLRGLRIVTFDKDDDSWGITLKARLQQALAETLDDTTRAVPSTFIDAALSARPSADSLELTLRRMTESLDALRTERGLSSDWFTTTVVLKVRSGQTVPVREIAEMIAEASDDLIQVLQTETINDDLRLTLLSPGTAILDQAMNKAMLHPCVAAVGWGKK
jgi:hypothetical protein